MVGVNRKLDIFREFPQFERLGAQDGMGDAKEPFFGLKRRTVGGLPCFGQLGELLGHHAGHDHVPDVVKQTGQICPVAFFLGHGEKLRVVFSEFLAQQSRAQAVRPEAADGKGRGKDVFAHGIRQGQVVDNAFDLVQAQPDQGFLGRGDGLDPAIDGRIGDGHDPGAEHGFGAHGFGDFLQVGVRGVEQLP